jgi:hypothetical protein
MLGAAVRDYHACGLDVLTPSAQGDCLEGLMLRLDGYSYSGAAATLYRDVRFTGVKFKQCLARATVSDVSACDGSPFYNFLSQLIDQVAHPPTP